MDYTEEMNEYIESGNIDKANEFLKLMKIEKIDMTSYENELKELILKKELNDTTNKLSDKQLFTSRINESISKQTYNLNRAKHIMTEMEETGNQILENLHDNHEKIKNIRQKVKETDEKITYANIITKRMASLFNRY